MFTVVIQVLAESSHELQQLIWKLNQQICEVEDVISSIKRMSVYDDVTHTLYTHLKNMETEQRKLIALMSTLSQVQKMYVQCEHNISDYGDQVRKVNYYRNMDVVGLELVQENIRNYHIN